MVFRIKEVRESKGLTQRGLSRLSGVPREQICRYERGKVTPDVGTLTKLAAALDCSMNDLVSNAK